MPDYPDHTIPTSIIAQTIAQLNVDIIAQTLAALDINITGQDLAELVINIAAQDVGIYLQPEWAALQGDDKNFSVGASNQTRGNGASASYTVTAGKTLYISGASFWIYANLAADSDKNQMGLAWLYNNTDLIYLATLGGNGGGGLSFPKPLVIPSEKEFKYFVLNRSNHNCDMYMSAWGYEI